MNIWKTCPGRFEFVFTPKHASWLKLVEGFFSKMPKQVLHGIRVDSKEELEERIYKYFDEINADPVVYPIGGRTYGMLIQMKMSKFKR